MAYMDAKSAAIPPEDLWFFFQEFERLATPLGIVINRQKTRIMLSCNGHSALTAILSKYPTIVSTSVTRAVQTYLVRKQGEMVE